MTSKRGVRYWHIRFQSLGLFTDTSWIRILESLPRYKMTSNPWVPWSITRTKHSYLLPGMGRMNGIFFGTSYTWAQMLKIIGLPIYYPSRVWSSSSKKCTAVVQSAAWDWPNSAGGISRRRQVSNVRRQLRHRPTFWLLWPAKIAIAVDQQSLPCME